MTRSVRPAAAAGARGAPPTPYEKGRGGADVPGGPCGRCGLR